MALSLFLTLSTLAANILAAPTCPSKSAAPLGAIPSYVLQYAPIVWLDSNESYFPGAVSSQLLNTHPSLNFTPVPPSSYPNPLTLSNLASLNSLGGPNVSLSSNLNFATDPPPAYLNGTKPTANGYVSGDPSCTIITVQHNTSFTDAFFMFFYPYNQGDIIFGQEAGDHIGDWEHFMLRFVDEKPTEAWFSQHSFGQAFTYDAVEKYNGTGRPVVYSGKGTHANYAISGVHDHTLQGGVNLPVPVFLVDYTSKGFLWDPRLNAYHYNYDIASNSFASYTSSNGTTNAPTSWLEYQGIWGDEELPKSDPRQKYILGITATAKYTAGPTGPMDKDLNRPNGPCPSSGGECIVRPFLTAKK